MSEVITTPVSREQALRDIIVSLEAMIRQQLPGFAFMPTAQRRRISLAGSLPDDFLESVAVSIETTPKMAVPSEANPAELRDTIARRRAFNTLADQLELMARGVRATSADQSADVGRRALSTYGTAKVVNRHVPLTVAVPHLDSMRRALGRSGRKKSQAKPPDSPPAKGGTTTQS